MHQEPAALTCGVEMERETRAAYSFEGLVVVRYRGEKICDHCSSPGTCCLLLIAYLKRASAYCLLHSIAAYPCSFWAASAALILPSARSSRICWRFSRL